MSEAIDVTPVIVTKEVLDELIAIRDSGDVNMFEYPKVVMYAQETGCINAHMWLVENKAMYSKGVFCGFISDPDDNCILN